MIAEANRAYLVHCYVKREGTWDRTQPIEDFYLYLSGIELETIAGSYKRSNLPYDHCKPSVRGKGLLCAPRQRLVTLHHVPME